MSAGNGVCNTLYLGDPAVELVDSGWTVFHNFATEAFALATSQITGINNFAIDAYTWDASFNADPTLSGFQRPVRPDLPAISVVDLSDQIPAVPSLSVSPVVLEASPAEPADLLNPPAIDVTLNPPAPLSATRPGDAPTMADIPAPDEMEYLTLIAPELFQPALPTAPTINISEFDEAAPIFSAVAPTEDMNFVENPYVSEMMDAVDAHLRTLMDGQALPPEIEAALWGRAMDREDQATQQAVQSVFEDFASRGFGPEPNGFMAKRIQSVRQDSRGKKSAANRDISIQNAQLAFQNVQFAITQGIQLEGKRIELHLAVEQRKFEYAVKLKDIAIAVFQARVQEYNAVVAAFNARIAAYQAFVEGQKAVVQVYAAQVDAAKVESEINTQLVSVYESQIRAEAVKADVYKAKIDGFRARLEAEQAKIEGFRAEVEAYKAEVETYKTEWDAERTRIEAQASRGQLYKTMVDAFAARVDVWKTKGDANIQNHRENLLAAQMTLQQQDAQVKTVLAKLEATRTVVQAQSAQADALARMYTADASVEGAAVEYDTRAYNAIVAKESTRLEILLKDAALQISQIQQRASLLLRAMESASQASSQLAASSMSAVNFSAGVNSSASRGEQCSTSFSFSGSIADAP